MAGTLKWLCIANAYPIRGSFYRMRPKNSPKPKMWFLCNLNWNFTKSCSWHFSRNLDFWFLQLTSVFNILKQMLQQLPFLHTSWPVYIKLVYNSFPDIWENSEWPHLIQPTLYNVYNDLQTLFVFLYIKCIYSANNRKR